MFFRTDAEEVSMFDKNKRIIFVNQAKMRNPLQ